MKIIQFMTIHTKLLKQLHIRFEKIDGFIRVHGGEFRTLVLFDYGLFDKIFDKIKYLKSEKNITDSTNHNFGRIRIDSYEKILTFYNVIIFIKLSQLLRIKMNITKYYILTESMFLKDLMLIKQECDICHYWCFLNFSFKFKPDFCNRCQNLLMMSILLL